MPNDQDVAAYIERLEARQGTMEPYQTSID